MDVWKDLFRPTPAPTKKSADNLLSENVLEENIFITGNTVIDSLHLILSKIEDSDIYRDRLMSLIFSNLNFVQQNGVIWCHHCHHMIKWLDLLIMYTN